MSRALLARLVRLERRQAEAEALAAEILALLEDWEHEDPEGLDAWLNSRPLNDVLNRTRERTAH